MKKTVAYYFLMFLLYTCSTHDNTMLVKKTFAVAPDIYDMNIIDEKQTFTSRIIGEDLQIDISYTPELLQQKNYPVVYITDGHWRRIDHKYLHYLSMKQQIPPLLVVGVGYTKKYNDGMIWKSRMKDLVHSPDEFLHALTREVFPRVEKRFSCSTQKRILYGASAGGHFTVYTFTHDMLQEKKDFYGYIGSSAYLKDSLLFNAIHSLKNKNGSGATLYLTYGGDEDRADFARPNNLMYKLIEKAGIKEFSFMHHVNQGRNHYTNTRPTLCDGVRLVLGNNESRGIGLQDLDFNVFRYDFHSNVQVYDWEVEEGFKDKSFDTTRAISGHPAKGSMKIRADFSKNDAGQVGLVFEKAIDLTDKECRVDLYVPPELAKLQYRLTFFVYSSFKWKLDRGGPVKIRKSGWQTYTHTWKSSSVEGDLRGVRRLGIMLHKPTQAPRWQGTLYLDNVSWH